jgi:hypothetical protein
VSWSSELKRRYNMSVEEYKELLDKQGGRCAFCRKKPRARDPRLAVDHDHRSGLVRGLLCKRCNHDLLGFFGEDPDYYQRIADYLRRPPARALFSAKFVPDSIGNVLGEQAVLPASPNERRAT